MPLLRSFGHGSVDATSGYRRCIYIDTEQTQNYFEQNNERTIRNSLIKPPTDFFPAKYNRCRKMRTQTGYLI